MLNTEPGYKDFCDFWEKNPVAEKVYLKLVDGSIQSLERFLKEVQGFPPEKVEQAKGQIFEHGFPINIATNEWKINFSYQIKFFLLNEYARIIEFVANKKVGNLEDREIDDVFSQKNENLAQYLASIFIQKLYNSLLKELQAVAGDSLLLARAEMRSVFNAFNSELNYNYKEDIESVTRITEKRRKQNKILRGGLRKRTGVSWTDENKKAFYKQVCKLPKISDMRMWEYAYKELTEKNFNFYVKEYLKKETPFKNVPKTIFNDAIKTWSKYKDELISPKPEEKPKAFEFRHAIHLLDYQEIKFSTAKKYFSEGKKLSNTSK